MHNTNKTQYRMAQNGNIAYRLWPIRQPSFHAKTPKKRNIILVNIWVFLKISVHPIFVSPYSLQGIRMIAMSNQPEAVK